MDKRRSVQKHVTAPPMFRRAPKPCDGRGRKNALENANNTRGNSTAQYRKWGAAKAGVDRCRQIVLCLSQCGGQTTSPFFKKRHGVLEIIVSKGDIVKSSIDALWEIYDIADDNVLYPTREALERIVAIAEDTIADAASVATSLAKEKGTSREAAPPKVGEDYMPRHAKVRIDALRGYKGCGRQLVRYVAFDGRKLWLSEQLFIQRFVHVSDCPCRQKGDQDGVSETEVLDKADAQS